MSKEKTKSLTVNCKKREYMDKRKIPRRQLQMGDVNVKQMQKCKYLGSILTGKCNTEIQTHIGTGDRCIPKAKKGADKRKDFVRNKEKNIGLLRDIHYLI